MIVAHSHRVDLRMIWQRRCCVSSSCPSCTALSLETSKSVSKQALLARSIHSLACINQVNITKVLRHFLHLFHSFDFDHQSQHKTTPLLRLNYHTMILLTLYRLLLVVTFSSQVLASCYYPAGIYMARDQRCIDNGTRDSFYCGPRARCLSDQIC